MKRIQSILLGLLLLAGLLPLAAHEGPYGRGGRHDAPRVQQPPAPTPPPGEKPPDDDQEEAQKREEEPEENESELQKEAQDKADGKGAEPSEEQTKKDEKWDVNNPPGPLSTVTIDVTEGTWMSLDVSPDGREIAFDLLGDIYVIPMAGGEAKALTSDIAWQMQPRYSPDGKHIAFTSDQ
ncbi:MAG: TolB family protein, partial [Thermoanaerobaculia bacterium]